MSVLRQLPSGVLLNETGTRLAQLPDGSLVSEQAASAVTIAGLVGAAVADGLLAAVYQGTTVAGAVGNAVAEGLSASITSGGETIISADVGDAAAAGALAAVYQGLTILAFVGNAAADGSSAAVASGTVVDGFVGNAAAAGSTASVTNTASGSFLTDVIINNTGTPWALQAVVWTWFPAGRLGSMELITALDGTGTTASDGRLTASGIPAGPGILMVAVRNASVALDDVYLETGTVA